VLLTAGTVARQDWPSEAGFMCVIRDRLNDAIAERFSIKTRLQLSTLGQS
jgi:hypothetical protein